PNIAAAVPLPAHAQLTSDPAAAYIAYGRAENALAAAERAWSIKKTPEIAWNRAVAAQALQHRDAAINDWKDYLQLDSKSQWAIDAREQLEKLEHPRAPE